MSLVGAMKNRHKHFHKTVQQKEQREQKTRPLALYIKLHDIKAEFIRILLGHLGAEVHNNYHIMK